MNSLRHYVGLVDQLGCKHAMHLLYWLLPLLPYIITHIPAIYSITSLSLWAKDSLNSAVIGSSKENTHRFNLISRIIRGIVISTNFYKKPITHQSLFDRWFDQMELESLMNSFEPRNPCASITDSEVLDNETKSSSNSLAGKNTYIETFNLIIVILNFFQSQSKIWTLILTFVVSSLLCFWQFCQF